MILTAYIDVNGQVMYLSPERQPHVLTEHYTWGNKNLLAKFPDKNIFTSAFAVDLQDSFAKRLTAAKTLDKTTEATAEVILRLIKTYTPSSQKENLSFENYAKDAASFLCSSVAVWGEPFQGPCCINAALKASEHSPRSTPLRVLRGIDQQGKRRQNWGCLRGVEEAA